MFKRLSFRLAIYIMLILVLIVGGASGLYAANSKQLYINSEKNFMCKAIQELNEIKISDDISKINKFLDKYYEHTYDLYICDNEITPVFSTKRMVDTTSIIQKNFINNIDRYKPDNMPVYEKKSKTNNERIVLRTKVNNFGKSYYIFIEESLKTSSAVFNFTNSFLIRLVAVFIVVSGAGVFILISKTTGSLRTLSDVAKEISKGDYLVRYNGKIRKDEVGVLAENLNFMADKIAENINNLNNYNFLLKEDNKRMTEYEAMRKRVLTNVTHELKTPLAIISSQVEMMNCTKDDNKKIYYYKSAMEEIDKMSKLISRLLNFSAGEKAVLGDQKESIRLDEYINDLCDKSIFLIESKKIKLNRDIEKCDIVASKENINHIFDNYFMNAISHSKSNGYIKVSLKKYQDKCRLSVFNKGSNISEEEREKIWTEFYKSVSATDDFNRVGIGLFIVKEISITNHEECGFDNLDGGVEFWYDFKIKD